MRFALTRRGADAPSDSDIAVQQAVENFGAAESDVPVSLDHHVDAEATRAVYEAVADAIYDDAPNRGHYPDGHLDRHIGVVERMADKLSADEQQLADQIRQDLARLRQIRRSLAGYRMARATMVGDISVDSLLREQPPSPPPAARPPRTARRSKKSTPNSGVAE